MQLCVRAFPILMYLGLCRIAVVTVGVIALDFIAEG